MTSFLIATSNPGKLRELKEGFQILKNKGIRLLSLEDVSVKEKPEENGKTFKDNALLKARFYAEKTNLPTVADDGGLTIDALSGQPGVKSRRWPGHEATDEELVTFTLEKLINVPLSNRRAQLTTCLCFFDPSSNESIFEQESVDGHIALKPLKNWTKGYPFRALFIVNRYNKYYDQLNRKEHEEINHRRKATLKMAEKLIGRV